jgi:Uma2 family endonuclease
MATATVQRKPADKAIPFLENGDRLGLSEFLRRYEAEPDVKKAELIEGEVHMPSPVRADLHAKPDGIIHGWLFNYSVMNDLEFYPNATLLLDTENSFQPDAILCSKPRKGGRVWLNGKGYLCGSPELVCEIAASSASIDLHSKFRIYRRNGVSEYLVWRTTDQAVDWFVLENDVYVPLPVGKDRKIHSRTFKGLVLDVPALLKMDGAKVLQSLSAAKR